jgi:hypothetical protein
MDWYPETFYWNGSLKYAAAAKTKPHQFSATIFEHLFTTEKEFIAHPRNVDLICSEFSSDFIG